MTEEDYKDIEENYAILDKIDFIPYLKEETDLWNIINAVEKDYDCTELTDNRVCEGFTFNWLCEDEIADYLVKRYGNRVKKHEETITNIYIELQDND